MVKTMVFIDSRVNDLYLLVSQFEAGTEYKVLDASYDGLLQIEESLAGKYDYSSIQIISHGAAGAITIGSTVLNSSNLLQYQSQLENMGHALTDSGDLLLYGCNVGAGATGEHFVETLEQFTDADVAASDDLTGGSAVGGDWKLEVTSDSIESKMPVADSSLQQYDNTLGYAEDYLLAELSYVTYFINQDEVFNSSEQKAKDIWSNIKEDWNILDAKIVDNFAATAFKFQNTIVIAYRGTDRLGDWFGADMAVGTFISDWNYQFEEAIKFAEEVKAKNDGNDRVLVAGHSLGGSLSQVVSQLFHWNGATFDPAGASDIIESEEYSHFVNEGNNNGPGADFVNYLVEHSVVSGVSGGHIGPIKYLDAYGNSFIEATRTLNSWSSPVCFFLEAYFLHSMPGIVELMESKANGSEADLWMNGYDSLIVKAVETSDVGSSNTPTDQGQNEFYASEYNPYVFANNRDNII